MGHGWNAFFRRLAAHPRWRQIYLDAQTGGSALFDKPTSEWSFPQQQVAMWLRYYDAFFQRVHMQRTATGVDIELVKASWYKYDVIVDSFMVWYDKKSRERFDASVSSARPRASQHQYTFVAAHR